MAKKIMCTFKRVT